METVPAAEPPAGPPKRARRFGQFSLLSLLTLMAVLCLAAAYLNVARRLAQSNALLEQARLKSVEQQHEIDRLRAQLGVITVTDPKKIHVLALRTE